MILTLISLLPFASLSMAATIKLDEISQGEKIKLIREVFENKFNVHVEAKDIENEMEVERALQILIDNGFIDENIQTKKGSGAESVGGSGG